MNRDLGRIYFGNIIDFNKCCLHVYYVKIKIQQKTDLDPIFKYIERAYKNSIESSGIPDKRER